MTLKNKHPHFQPLFTFTTCFTKSSNSLWRKLSWDRSTLWSVDRRYVMYLRLCILQRDLDSLKRWNNAWGMKFNMKMSNSVHRQWTSHPTYLSICTCGHILSSAVSDVQNTLKKYFEITKIKYSYKVF